MRGVRMQGAACAMKARRAADDAGAADAGSTGTSTTVYTPTFSGSAGELGRLNTYNSDGDNTVQNCYTAPGVARQCNGK